MLSVFHILVTHLLFTKAVWGKNIYPILQKRRLRHREVKY